MFFCSVGLIGGAIGNTIVTYFVKKYNKTWYGRFRGEGGPISYKSFAGGWPD
jgi:hypothetical protein